jgi:valyl-tRNA synthetase
MSGNQANEPNQGKPNQPDLSKMTPEELEAYRQKEAKKKEKQDAKNAKKAKAQEKAAAAAAAKAKGGDAKASGKAAAGKGDGAPAKAAAAKDGPRLRTEFANTTPKGEKKDLSGPMAPAYDPAMVEAAWYDWWIAQGFFKPGAASHDHSQGEEEKFVMVIPPPNVTGSLHLGHALTNSIQDALTRWHRMQGRTALWVPGTDHAGIATQVVVEKKIAREENITRHQLGREEFVRRVWQWKEQYGGRIVNQLKRLGSSLDWEHEVFTMDERLSRAVCEAFVQYHERDLIYRSHRLINWCVKLQTAISDIEVDYIELEKRTELPVPGYKDKYPFGFLYEFAYKIRNADGSASDQEIVVATTRPETMLGDTAIAVHSQDPRYKALHGKSVVHPFAPERSVPIVTDDVLVDMAFGTGAVKVTPAHDPNDYETGKRHSLEFINILEKNGTIVAGYGEFSAMRRFDARLAVMKKLKELGLERGIRENPMKIATCSRSGDIIEPLIMPQWFVKTTEMAPAAIEAVRSGELKLFPPEANDVWYRWMENMRDWCISRQLWWGHRIPAYMVCVDGVRPANDTHDAWVVARTQEEALAKAAASRGIDASRITLEQDPDVLDTWFSSGLFPFSVFGWPEQTEDLKRFYPTALLETGKDILFFWVARMVMMGQTLTGQLPFKEVLLHTIVRDAHGEKMSKSKGNVIDPVDVIEGITLDALHRQLEGGNLDAQAIAQAVDGQKKMFPNGISECGTDALRFALCAYMSQSRDINLDINRVVGYRNFCNKLWNITKFALLKLDDGFVPAPLYERPALLHEQENALSVVDRWILSRLNNAVEVANRGFASYNFESITTACFSFWLYELADVYLEAIKPVLLDESEQGAASRAACRETLYTCLETALRMISPLMPFISEELWQRLPRRAGERAPSICVASYPRPTDGWSSASAEQDVQLAQSIVHELRSMRSSYNIPSSKKIPTLINFHDDAMLQRVQPLVGAIEVLSYSSSTTLARSAAASAGTAIGIVNPACEVHLDIRQYVDVEQETKKLLGKLENFRRQLAALGKTMAIADYENKVPAAVRQANSEKKKELEDQVELTLKAVALFEAMKK